MRHKHGKVAIIVLNWNRLQDTLLCLESLRNQSYDNYEIFVIDNASSEKSTRLTLDAVRSKTVHILYNSRNLGFAGGVNVGIRRALRNKFDYVALINNDATAHSDWLAMLVRASIDNESAITTGLVIHSDEKTIDSTGDWYSIWGMPFPRDRNAPAVKIPRSGTVFGGSGAGTLYTTQLLREVGLFDEDFFMYYEDVDLSFRAQLYGYTAFYTQHAMVYHKRGASSITVPGLAIYHTFKNLPLLFIKNVPFRLMLVIAPRFTLAYSLILGNAIRKGAGVYAVRGYLAQIPLFWFHALPARVKIQREKKVSTSYIRSILWPDLPPDQTGLRKFRSLFTGKK